MADKAFDGYMTKLGEVIKDLRNIAGDVDVNIDGLNEGKCASSINWIAQCLENIKNELNKTSEIDLANKKKV